MTTNPLARGSSPVVAFIVFLSILAGRVQATDLPIWGVVQPQTYASPNKTFALDVRPHDRMGVGSASYRLTRNGAEAWSGDKAYALRAVSVTDAGFVVGIAYRQVPVVRDDRESDPEEYFHVVILNEQGFEVLNDEQCRIPPGARFFPPMPTPPYAQQVLVDPDHDRMVLRTIEPNGETGEPKWRVHSLTDGRKSDRFAANDIGVLDNWSVTGAGLIPGTPLILVHWFRSTVKPEERQGGFVLLNIEGRPFWKLDAENDYRKIQLPDSPWGIPLGDAKRFFERSPAILDVGREQFRIRFYDRAEQELYRVEPASGGVWKISLVEKSAYVPPAAVAPDNNAPQPLRYLGKVELGTPEETASPFGAIQQFTLDRAGRIHFTYRDAESRWGKRTIDDNGTIIKESPLVNPSKPSIFHWNDCPRAEDDRYIELRDDGPEPGSYTAHLVSLETESNEPLPNYRGHYARTISRSRSGDYAIIEFEGVTRYRADGTVHWKSTGNDEEDLDSHPVSLAILSDDRVAVLGFNKVTLLDKDGRATQSVNLMGAFGDNEFGGRPSYLHEIVADADGGFLIKDSRTPPVVLRFSGDGSVRSRWSPRFADGRTVTIDPGVRVAADGRLWTSDGRRFLRLTDDGVVDLVVGASAETDSLDELAGFTVGYDGRWYAVSRGAGEVHVFDPSGRLAHVAKPEPDDHPGSLRDAFVIVAQSGDVYVERPKTVAMNAPDEYVQFSGSGQRIGIVSFEPWLSVPPFGAGWAIQPGKGYRCGMTRGEKLVISDPAATVVREIVKRPDGSWFGMRCRFAMASDGTMAVATSSAEAVRSVSVDLFAANGDGIKSIPIPPPAIKFSALAYDGNRAVLVGKGEAIAITTADGGMTRWRLAPEHGGLRCSAFLIADGRELLLFEATSMGGRGPGGSLYRYALP